MIALGYYAAEFKNLTDASSYVSGLPSVFYFNFNQSSIQSERKVILKNKLMCRAKNNKKIPKLYVMEVVCRSVVKQCTN